MGVFRAWDELGLTTPAEFAELSEEISLDPFDVRLITLENLNQGDLACLVVAPNEVLLGINPTICRAFLRFGERFCVSPEDVDAIGLAGTESFKKGEWTAGIRLTLLQVEKFWGK